MPYFTVRDYAPNGNLHAGGARGPLSGAPLHLDRGDGEIFGGAVLSATRSS